MKTITFKKTLLTAAILSAMTLTGCGGSSSSNTPPDAGNTTDTTSTTDNTTDTTSTTDSKSSSQFYVVTDVEDDASNSDIEGLVLNRIETSTTVEQFFLDYPSLADINLNSRSLFAGFPSEASAYLVDLERIDPIGLTVSYEYSDGYNGPFNGVVDTSPVSILVEDGKVTKFKYGSGSDYTESRMVYDSNNKLTKVDSYDNNGTFVSTLFKFDHNTSGQLIEEIIFGEVSATRKTYEYGTPTRSTSNTSTRIIRQYDNVSFDATNYTLTGSGTLSRKYYEEYDASSRLAFQLRDLNSPDDSNTVYEYGYSWLYDNDNHLTEYHDLRTLDSTPIRNLWRFTKSNSGSYQKVLTERTRTNNGTWNSTTYQFSGGTTRPTEFKENNYFDENSNLVAVERLDGVTGNPTRINVFEFDNENRITSVKYFESSTANAADFNYLDANDQVNNYSTWVAKETYTNRFYDEKPSCNVIYQNTTIATPTDCALEPTPDMSITSDSTKSLK